MKKNIDTIIKPATLHCVNMMFTMRKVAGLCSVNAEIHSLLVVDSDNKLVGIVDYFAIMN